MNRTIAINKSDILPEVYKETGYMGKKQGDMAKVASTEDDTALLDSYFSDACNSLADVISRYGYPSQETSSAVTFTLELPSNWKTGVEGALTKAMKLYVVSFIVLQWFNLAKDDKMQFYSTKLISIQESVLKYILEREKPARN